jgi:hypothetical protein
LRLRYRSPERAAEGALGGAPAEERRCSLHVSTNRSAAWPVVKGLTVVGRSMQMRHRWCHLHPCWPSCRRLRLCGSLVACDCVRCNRLADTDWNKTTRNHIKVKLRRANARGCDVRPRDDGRMFSVAQG